MPRPLFSKFTSHLLFCLSYTLNTSAEENFLLMNGTSNTKILEIGPRINERISPCSTFKIALSLMGFDAKILRDAKTPLWLFQDGYTEYLESWKAPQTPQSWIKTSCVWYSQVLATQLGKENIQHYLTALKYGNQDMSGGVTQFWLMSSLKISPKEQVDFIQKMVQGTLPISSKAIQTTKSLLFIEKLPNGWKLFGKTGLGESVNELDGPNFETGWFVGWAEKEHNFFPFAYTICENKINTSQRIPRVKQLLIEFLPIEKTD